MTNRVYVDARVEGVQDPKLPRKAYVAYIVEGVAGLQGFAEVDASETDKKPAIQGTVTSILWRFKGLSGPRDSSRGPRDRGNHGHSISKPFFRDRIPETVSKG